MTKQTVYQTDRNGFYAGETLAEESPLEPGVYLIPGGCVKDPPPEEIPAGSVARWIDGQWTVVVAAGIELTLTQAQAAGLAKLQAACEAAIVGGFVSDATGTALSYTLTDTDQANLDSAYLLARMAEARANAWKAGAEHVLNDVLAVDGDYVLCTTAGSSGTAAPAWPTAYQVEVADGTAGWSRAGYLVGTSDGTIWVSAAEATALWVASKSHIATCRAIYRTAKAAIDAATTASEIEAAVAAVKWP